VKGRGAEYIDASSLVLVFASSGYFESANCVRELLRAVVTATPLATMLEPEVNKGGMTVEQIEAQVRAMYEPCEKHGTQFANKLTMWGLDKEILEWGLPMPTAAMLMEALFADELSEWNRIGAFQDVTLCLLAERILAQEMTLKQRKQSMQVTRAVVAGASEPPMSFRSSEATPRSSAEVREVYVQDSVLSIQLPVLHKPRTKALDGCHIWCSRHNVGVLDLLEEVSMTLHASLQVEHPQQISPQRSPSVLLRTLSQSGGRFGAMAADAARHVAGNARYVADNVRHVADNVVDGVREVSEVVESGVAAAIIPARRHQGASTSSPERHRKTTKGTLRVCYGATRQLPSCDHMLLYLNDLTWTSGDAESAALAADVTAAMEAGVHILLAHEMLGLGQEQRHPSPFGVFFACEHGTTPTELLRRGLYNEIAIALRGGEWRRVSMVILSRAIIGSGDAQLEEGSEQRKLKQYVNGLRRMGTNLRNTSARITMKRLPRLNVRRPVISRPSIASGSQSSAASEAPPADPGTEYPAAPSHVHFEPPRVQIELTTATAAASTDSDEKHEESFV